MRRTPALERLPSEDDHAARFARQREADRTAVAEDYVELIADLLRAEGEARAVDLARRMGVSQATVANTIARLQRDGLVETRPYRGLFLTEAGANLATRAKARHELVVRFLIAVGLDGETAEADAEGLEHHASEKALAAFARFLERQQRKGR
ncbi:MAG: manganese-binding transcriptional regulator MntR [Rubritepida sp.]|jgi:DtxR family manganese transport transcriptional regulator|nr:manganese-binding transcriptional regulator MntR [Rubritepida sp.]